MAILVRAFEQHKRLGVYQTGLLALVFSDFESSNCQEGQQGGGVEEKGGPGMMQLVPHRRPETGYSRNGLLDFSLEDRLNMQAMSFSSGLGMPSDPGLHHRSTPNGSLCQVPLKSAAPSSTGTRSPDHRHSLDQSVRSEALSDDEEHKGRLQLQGYQQQVIYERASRFGVADKQHAGLGAGAVKSTLKLLAESVQPPLLGTYLKLGLPGVCVCVDACSAYDFLLLGTYLKLGLPGVCICVDACSAYVFDCWQFF